MDLLLTPKLVLPSIYGVFAVVVYTAVAHVIYKHPNKFQQAFYELFLVGYVMNMICYFNSYFTMRIPQHVKPNGTFYDFYASLNANKTDTFPLSVFHMLHFEFAYTQYIFNGLICANRWTAIRYSYKDEKYWSNYLWLIVTAMFVVPFLLFTRQLFFGRSFFTWNPINSAFYIDSTYGRAKIYRCLTPFLVIVTILNTAMNWATWRKINDMKKKDKNVHIQGSSLFYISFAGFCIEAFLACLTVFLFFITNFNESIITWILFKIVAFLVPFSSDALTLTQPLLVLYYSKSTREAFFNQFPFLQRFKKPVVIAQSEIEEVIVDTRNL